MKRFINLCAVYVLPVVGTVGTAWQLSQEKTMCIIGIILGHILGIIAFFIRKTYRKYALICVLGGIVMIVFSLSSFMNMKLQQNRDNIWKKYIMAKVSDNVDELKIRADENDGPAQYRLAMKYFDTGDYVNARIYAQKSADNGNAMGYCCLTSIYLNGLGCPKDVHQAVSNMIKAKRLGNLQFDLEYEEKFLSDTMSESDLLAIRDCNADAFLINSMMEQIEVDKITVEDYIDLHHEELTKLSVKGFIPATELLYCRELTKHPDGSEELMRLSSMLYKANVIPTEPIERYRFFHYYKKMKDYDSRYYSKYIHDNIYLHLYFTDVVNRDRKSYSDSLLISEYMLYRSQLNWCRDLVNNDRKRISFTIGHKANYENDYIFAKRLLKQNIEAIQSRMDSVGKYDFKKDLLNQLRFENISFQNVSE